MKLVITATIQQARFAAILLWGDVKDTFTKAREYGYDGIELHLRDPHEVDANEVAKLSHRYSFPVTAIGTGAGARMDGLTFTDPRQEIRDQAVSRIKGHIKLAETLKSAVIIGSMNGNVGCDSDEQPRKIKSYHMECVKQCCHAASKSGTTILLEPLNRYEADWLNTTKDCIDIIEKAGCENLKYLADTFHMNIEEIDICQSLRDAGSKLGYVHLVDSNRCYPGQGHLAVKDILQTLNDIGYDGVLSFECLPEPDVESASINSLNYVRKIALELKR